MTISNRTLVQIAAWGGVILGSTGLFLQFRLVDNVRQADYYKSALKTLRTHSGAVHYLGEPIKDGSIKLSDKQNNIYSANNAQLCVPVSGPKDKGNYYFWSEKFDDGWKLTKAELELKSKPDARLIIAKSKE